MVRKPESTQKRNDECIFSFSKTKNADDLNLKDLRLVDENSHFISRDPLLIALQEVDDLNTLFSCSLVCKTWHSVFHQLKKCNTVWKRHFVRLLPDFVLPCAFLNEAMFLEHEYATTSWYIAFRRAWRPFSKEERPSRILPQNSVDNFVREIAQDYLTDLWFTPQAFSLLADAADEFLEGCFTTAAELFGDTPSDEQLLAVLQCKRSQSEGKDYNFQISSDDEDEDDDSDYSPPDTDDDEVEYNGVTSSELIHLHENMFDYDEMDLDYCWVGAPPEFVEAVLDVIHIEENEVGPEDYYDYNSYEPDYEENKYMPNTKFLIPDDDAYWEDLNECADLGRRLETIDPKTACDDIFGLHYQLLFTKSNLERLYKIRPDLINARDMLGSTALHRILTPYVGWSKNRAGTENHQDILEFFSKEQRIDVNEPDNSGVTVAMQFYASEYWIDEFQWDSDENQYSNLIFSDEWKPELQDKRGFTIFDYNPYLLRSNAQKAQLLPFQLKMEILTRMIIGGRGFQFILILLGYKFSSDAEDESDQSGLSEITETNEIMKEALKWRDVDNFGNSLLHYTVYPNPCQETVEVMRFFLSQGANPKNTNDDGLTPYDEAVDAGFKDYAELLISQSEHTLMQD